MTWGIGNDETAVPMGLSVLLLAIGTTDGNGLNGASAIVSITTVSGYAGHAFVYAQVSQSTVPTPHPPGRVTSHPTSPNGFPKPVATRHVKGSGPSTYLTGHQCQINAPPPSARSPNFGTRPPYGHPTTTPSTSRRCRTQMLGWTSICRSASRPPSRRRGRLSVSLGRAQQCLDAGPESLPEHGHRGLAP